MWSVAGMVAMGSSLTFGSSLPKPQFYSVNRLQARLPDVPAKIGKAARLQPAAPKATPPQMLVTASFVTDEAKPARPTAVAFVVEASDHTDHTARFDAVVKQAGLTSDKLAGLFPLSAGSPSHHLVAKAAPPAPKAAPAPKAIAALPAGSVDQPQNMLAYAAPSPGGSAGAALSSLLTQPSEEDLAALEAPSLDLDAADALPVYDDTPSDGPLPRFRPRGDLAGKPAAGPDVKKAEEPAMPKAGDADEREAAKPKQLAYAKPNVPVEKTPVNSLGRTLRNMLGGGARAGHGVAVYDISAAKVYMPDGSVLEAHSGIGKMADNPRYVNVQMTGPTPPHTYNLKMRETRFHGVEAIRMLPVDGRNKYGRDGFLTHSYLLRGRMAQSHGCVAFKDYKRFLAAFKQGKVKQIVVVPSGGQATMLASNGGKNI